MRVGEWLGQHDLQLQGGGGSGVSARTHLPAGLVTFLFTDIEGSTRLAQMLGSQYRSVLAEHREVLRGALSTAQSAELFTEGDSLFMAFPDASAALHACALAQRQLADHVWPVPQVRPLVRMGLHTGYAEPHGGEYASPEVHRAARVVAAAHGGQILCSAATAAQATAALQDDLWLLDLGLHRLRGFDGRERLFQLVAPGLERQFPRLRTAEATTHNLPVSVTTFVGRATELQQLRALVSSHRLVTVVGAGGAGKTRLAVELASELLDAYPDGVWFADLATVSDPGLADVAIAATFGLPGEVVWRIPSLSLRRPASGGPSDAVALLVDRATAARGGNPPTADEVAEFNRVASALAGLPLALELAAARLRVLSASQLAARLDDVLGTLDAGIEPADGDLPVNVRAAVDRHRTMQATVTWSYRTLDTEAAKLLRWLSVFAGPVELPAIEWLIGSDPLARLARLVDKSLLLAEPSPAGTTYRMLDPIRAYAAKRLVDAGEEEAARDRHVAWCLHATHQANRDRAGRPVTVSLYALDPLADELRAALHWAVTRGSLRQGFALAGGLDQWWRERGLAREGRMWLFRLYDRISSSGGRISNADVAEAYRMHSLHAGADGEYVEELHFSQRAEAAARRSSDPGLLARVLSGRGAPLLDMGCEEEAERACREVIDWG